MSVHAHLYKVNPISSESPFYRVLIIPSNMTLSFHVVIFQSMSHLLGTSKYYDVYRLLYCAGCVSGNCVKSIYQRLTEY